MARKSSRSAGSSEVAWATRLGSELRARRKLLRLTQEELAVLAGCGPDFLYDLERGKPTVRLDKLVPVLDVLGLELKVGPRGPATNE
jgi:HTH-type transcriptional regulator/antitoxin HipB